MQQGGGGKGLDFLIWVVIVVFGLVGERKEGGRFWRIGGDF